MKNIIMQEETSGRAVHNTYIVIVLHFIQRYFYEFIIPKINGSHLGGLVHKLIGKQGIITYYINMVTIGRMDNIINSNIPVK
ncbi:MAG: hypothetical protein JWM28_2110 [Chitinophagaceae bacterium]|nr:hypothetical protein [Chitinophagaceae bacterium]